nr:two-pore potassium channel 5 [Tanacetum cinerariifolium]
MKVCLTLGVVMLSIRIGVFVFYFVKGLGWVDSFYLSVTTVRYGDRAFKTLEGRLFASFWLLFSTLMVARAFLYLAEARIDRRHRRVVNWVLQREITVKDLLDADMNNNGFLIKSEYIVFKLKELGKTDERDILQICSQSRKVDSSNSRYMSYDAINEIWSSIISSLHVPGKTTKLARIKYFFLLYNLCTRWNAAS